MKKLPPSLVLVEWDDAVQDSEPWPTKEEVEEFGPETVFAVGWLIKKTKKHYTLAKHWNENGVGGLWAIPRGMVVNCTVLMKGSEMGKIVNGKVHCKPVKKSK